MSTYDIICKCFANMVTKIGPNRTGRSDLFNRKSLASSVRNTQRPALRVEPAKLGQTRSKPQSVDPGEPRLDRD